MSFQKISNVDEITVLENGIILYRINNIVKENDVEIAQNYVRNSLSPDSDLTDIPANVVTIANVVWTPEVITAYKANIQEKLSQTTLTAG